MMITEPVPSTSTPRRPRWKSGLLALLFVPVAQFSDDEFAGRFAPLEGTTPAQWRVSWTKDPSTAATISWTTAEAGTTHRVHIDVESRAGGGEYAMVEESHRDGAYTVSDKDAEAGFYHHVALTDLAPSTAYWFVLESDGVRSREFWFVTAPADDRAFSLLVGGDSRTGWRARCFLNLAMARLLGEDDSILALCHGGDFVMLGDRWDHWTKWLSHHELTTTKSGRVLPVVPTRGNHDFGAPFDEIFDDPGTAKRNYFRTSLSDDVAILTLNSNIPVTGDQMTWLEGALEQAVSDSRWVLANYHRPLYPAVKSPGEAKPFWPPLFDRFGVDLVLESDGHCIKRTVPIRGDELHLEGTVYVGEGGLGVPQRNPRSDPWYLQPPGMVSNGHHVLRLDFSATELRGRFLGLGELPGEVDPEDYTLVIEPNHTWSYMRGDEFPEGWNSPDYDTARWPVSRAGFGFDDDDDVTVLEDMRKNYSTLAIRRGFRSTAVDDVEQLSLVCRYDDAFIAYLNGVEVARAGIEDRPGKKPKIRSHEARSFELFEIEGWKELIRPGINILAIEGHNYSRSDRDFTLDPWLAGDREQDRTQEGLPFEVLDDFKLQPRKR